MDGDKEIDMRMCSAKAQAVRAGLLALGLASLAAPAVAAPEDFNVVIPKFDFVEAGKPFGPNDRLIVKIRGFDPARYPNLRARIFWGSKQDLPQRYHRVVAAARGSSERCLVYDAIVPAVRLSRASVDLGWVPSSPPGEERHWVAVFESGEWRRGPIKISESAADAYFASGYEFTVEAPAPPRPARGLMATIAILFTGRGGGSSTLALQPAPGAESRESRRLEERWKAIDQTAAEEVVCIHFRSRDEQTLVAEAGRCGGCQRQDPEAASWSAALRLARLIP